METAIGILAAILGVAIVFWYVRMKVRQYKALYAEAKTYLKKD